MRRTEAALPAPLELPGRAAPRSDWADAAQAAAVPVALPLARGHRAGLHGGGEGSQRRRAGAAEIPGRFAVDQARRRGRAAGGAGGPAGGLCRAAPVHLAVHRAARADLRQGHRRRGAQHLAAGVPPPACVEPALPSRTADRRHDPRHRTRHARGALADLVFAVQHRAHLDRDGDGADLARDQVRPVVRVDHRCGAGGLHRLHRHRHRMAHEVPPPDERARFGGAHPCHRFAAELRDGQVLQQRGLRGPALRRKPREAAPCGVEEPEHAEPAQHGSATGHRRGAGGDVVARHAGCRRRPADARRPGDDQRLHDPAVHPAELPGRAVSGDQAEPDRPGQDVPHARNPPRGGRRARRSAAAGQRTARCASST